MPDKKDVLLERLLAMFRIEAEAHLKDISSGLLALEGKPVIPQRSISLRTCCGAHIVSKVQHEQSTLPKSRRPAVLWKMYSLH